MTFRFIVEFLTTILKLRPFGLIKTVKNYYDYHEDGNNKIRFFPLLQLWQCTRATSSFISHNDYNTVTSLILAITYIGTLWPGEI